jgi:ribosomal protein S18 acetylase RimI-like enzyme
MTLIFRPAVPAERDDVDRVLRAAFTPYARALGRELSAAGFARLPAELERGDIHVALDAGTIIGVVRTERRDDELYIDQIGVDPARQRAGLGSWLLGRIEEVARSSGARRMSLNTAEMMEHLVRLYRRHGFEIIHRGPPDHGLDTHTRVYMAKAF